MSDIQFLTHTTPFPNTLLDQVMPTLKDTEWRVLCVIVRQTLGWRGNASVRKRKDTDWLSRKQLMAKTSRYPEALSNAIDSLLGRGLIDVFDDKGHRLQTRLQRRYAGGRLYYCLSPKITSQAGTSSKSEQTYSEIEQGCSKTSVRKPNATKETQTKYTSNDVVDGSKTIGKRDNARFHGTGKTNSHKRRHTTEPPNPDVKRFFAAYIATFRKYTASGDPPPISWGKDGKLIKDLLRVYSYNRLVDLLRQFFKSEDPWVRRLGYSIGAFRASISKLLVNEEVTTTYQRDPKTGDWVKLNEERT